MLANLYNTRHNFAILAYMKSLSLAKPHLIVMVGVPGAGKSFFAHKFADMFGAPCVSQDTIRATVSFNQPTYSRDEQETVDNLAYDQLEQLFKTKVTIIVDGGSETRASRQDMARQARVNGYETLFVWVQTDPMTAKNRATVGSRGRGSQPVLLNDEQYMSMIRRFTPPSQSEPFVVISGKHTYSTQARAILKKLSEPRAKKSNTIQPPNDRPDKPGRRVIVQ